MPWAVNLGERHRELVGEFAVLEWFGDNLMRSLSDVSSSFGSRSTYVGGFWSALCVVEYRTSVSAQA